MRFRLKLNPKSHIGIRAVSDILSVLMRTGKCREISLKFSCIKFHEIEFSDSQVIPFGQAELSNTRDEHSADFSSRCATNM